MEFRLDRGGCGAVAIAKTVDGNHSFDDRIMSSDQAYRTIQTTMLRRLGYAIRMSFVFFVVVLFLARTSSAQSVFGENAATAPPVIVIGFVGGFISHDNLAHSEVQLAAQLRKKYPVGVDVETFESYAGKKATKKVLSLLDTNHDGDLTSAEKQNARIIIYGHSWGGSQALDLARKLQKEGIPVLLTIQVDSISKVYQNDAVIPANVAQAANFYQPHGLLRGQSKIRAANPAHTKIIGNFRFDYNSTPYTCDKYPWYDRVFVKAHTQIECDPSVWKQAEDLIVSNLTTATGRGSATGR